MDLRYFSTEYNNKTVLYLNENMHVNIADFIFFFFEQKSVSTDIKAISK